VFGKFGMTKTDGVAIIGGIFSNVKDFKSEVVGLHGNDEFAALEWQSSGILTGEHELLPKVAIGETIRAVGVGLYEVKNQKVVRESTSRSLPAVPVLTATLSGVRQVGRQLPQVGAASCILHRMPRAQPS
jgi:hypothetical protein